jgi:hypothetical protein
MFPFSAMSCSKNWHLLKFWKYKFKSIIFIQKFVPVFCNAMLEKLTFAEVLERKILLFNFKETFSALLQTFVPVFCYVMVKKLTFVEIPVH